MKIWLFIGAAVIALFALSIPGMNAQSMEIAAMMNQIPGVHATVNGK